ncbi:MAG: mannosyltransferase, partial [Actinomycetota bacterium]|nr:mannosyltransferase [Actinomycetota bacterium]
MTVLSEADARLHRWLPSVRARAVIATAFVASVTLQIVGIPLTSSFGTRTRIDLDVYRLGAQIWQQGQSLYADGSMPFTSDGIWLPFTYPPFAAIGFVPLGMLGLGLAGLL